MWGKLWFLILWKSLSWKSLGSLNKYKEPHWALISITTMKDKKLLSIFSSSSRVTSPLCSVWNLWDDHPWWPRCLLLPVMSMVMMSFWQLPLSHPQTKVIVDGYIYVKKKIFQQPNFSTYLCHFLCAVSALDLSILWGGMILNVLQTTYANGRGWGSKRNLVLWLSHGNVFSGVSMRRYLV